MVGNSGNTVVLPTIDLAVVVDQLKRKAEFAGWGDDRFQLAELEYRRFLGLCKSYPTARLAPSPDADEIWHRHMLNSQKYMLDCQEYFGYYLHHEPLDPANGSDDTEPSTDEQDDLYAREFGQSVLHAGKCSHRPCTTCKPTRGYVEAHVQ
jgi:hypothetical protein